MTSLRSTLLAAALAGLTASPALADECSKVTLADVGWTDVTVTTAVAATLLEALGYEPEVKLLALPVTLAGLSAGDVDVFLGVWLPSMEADIRPYLDDGRIADLRRNLAGAKYTLATNAPGAALGIASFADIAARSKALGGKIYAIEPGNDGNRLILDMVKADAFGLKDFQVAESSEQGMLAQVDRATRRKEPVIFLGWAPHPMNAKYDMTYLEGGDDWFGPDLGGAEVRTVTRKGYAEACPNLGKLFGNLEFSLEMENALMGAVLDDKAEPRDAANAWIAGNRATADAWLEGVVARDGGDALAALNAALD